MDVPPVLDVLPVRLTEGAPLDEQDFALIEAAHGVLRRHYRPLWHTVAAAIRGRDGQIHTGLHIGATVGRMSICAEAVAFGRAVLDGDGSVATVVAVRHPKPDEVDRDLAVVSPCGACREMFCDFEPEALVIVPGLTGLMKLPIRSLLPLPYRR